MTPTQLLQKLAARTSWLTSKKFLAMALGVTTLCVSRFWPQQAEFAKQLAALITFYVLGQSGVDMVQKNAEGRALAAYLAPIEPPSATPTETKPEACAPGIPSEEEPQG